MNTLIESLGATGSWWLAFAVPTFLQSSLLILVLLGVEGLLRRRTTAALRHALWLLVLVKLVTPPSLALPSGLVGWLPAHWTAWLAQPPPVAVEAGVSPGHARRTGPALTVARASLPVRPGGASAEPGAVRLGWGGWLFAGWLGGLMVLAAAVGRRAWRVSSVVRGATAAPSPLGAALEGCRQTLRLRRPVALRVSSHAGTAVVCGLWRPVILLPAGLAERLTPAALRGVLMHELAHVVRGDLWVNAAQSLLQVLYWWHPLLWLSNNQTRRVREEAADEMVMAVLGDAAESYPETLLAVARFSLDHPSPSPGVVGILESSHPLRDRVQRLLDAPSRRRARLGWGGAVAMVAAGGVLLPMAHGTRPGAAFTNNPLDSVLTIRAPHRTPSPATTTLTSGMLLAAESRATRDPADMRPPLANDGGSPTSALPADPGFGVIKLTLKPEGAGATALVGYQFEGASSGLRSAEQDQRGGNGGELTQGHHRRLRSVLLAGPHATVDRGPADGVGGARGPRA